MRVLLEPYAMDWMMQVIIFCFSPSSSFAAPAVFTSGASIVISEDCVFLNATWMKFEHLMLQEFPRQHMHYNLVFLHHAGSIRLDESR